MPRHSHAKKIVYLEPVHPGSKTVRTKITRILPAPSPPSPPPRIIELPPPPPPEPEVVIESSSSSSTSEEEDDTIDVIAVDVEPSVKSSKSHKSKKSSKKSSHSRKSSHGGSRDREVYIEREKVIVPVRVQPEYETYRYVEAPAPRRPALPEPPKTDERERMRITIEDRRSEREREYYYR